MRIRRLSIGLVLVIISLICTVIGFIYYGLTFSAFKYEADKNLITCSVVAIWLFMILIFVGLFDDNQPWFISIIYVVMPFLIMFSAIKLLTPSLQAIGIYFSVGGMGDVETNAVAVPRCIAGLVFYAIALITCIASSFFRLGKNSKEKEPKND